MYLHLSSINCVRASVDFFTSTISRAPLLATAQYCSSYSPANTLELAVTIFIPNAQLSVKRNDSFMKHLLLTNKSSREFALFY